MAKFTKISMVSPRAPLAPDTEDYEALVQNMIGFLSGGLSRVLPDRPDIILVPEACDRYPNLPMEKRKKYYQVRGDRIRDFYCQVARENHCYIAYSACRNTPWDEKFPYRNSTQIIDREGEIVGIYDKNHLVISENTNAGIAYGTEATVFPLDFGPVACAICFDLNFEELLRKYIPQKPRLIVFCSQYHGGLSQAYWAYSCRSYFAGAVCGAQSRILNPFGETVAASTNYYDYITGRVNLDYAVAHLDYNRPKFDAAKKKYGEALTVHDPGYVGSVLLTCEDPDLCIEDIVKEFEIELLDDYLDRSRAHRLAHLS